VVASRVHVAPAAHSHRHSGEEGATRTDNTQERRELWRRRDCFAERGCRAATIRRFSV
jgi:hypothetical protein